MEFSLVVILMFETKYYILHIVAKLSIHFLVKLYFAHLFLKKLIRWKFGDFHLINA